METHVLVTYAGRYGGAQEIAEDVVRVLYERGVQAALKPTNEVNGLSPYHAVIMGSDLSGGQWLPEAVVFLQRFAVPLAAVPLWLFSSSRPEHLPEQVAPATPPTPGSGRLPLRPRGHAVFEAKGSPRKSPGELWRYHLLRDTPEDYRDWDEVEAWANSVASTLPGGNLTLPPPGRRYPPGVN